MVSGAVGFDTSEIRAFARQFDGADRIVMNELTTAFDRGGTVILERARGNINHWRGGLSRGGKKTTSVSARSIRTLVEFIAMNKGFNYAIAVEFGRGAIEARNGRVLRFQLRSGQILFRKRVGPAKPQFFLTRAFDASKGSIDREVDAAAARIVARVVR